MNQYEENPMGIYKRDFFFVIKLVQLNITKLTMWKVKGNERLKDAIVITCTSTVIFKTQ